MCQKSERHTKTLPKNEKGMNNLAQFTNQAQLTYNNTVAVSNLAVGEIQDVLSITKTAVTEAYTANDSVPYVINIINSGNTDLTNLTLTDNLGSYTMDTNTFTPLTYSANSLRYFRNNVIQPSPTVTSGNTLTVTGFTVPAGGSATFVYETHTNEYTPLQPESIITNIATLTGNLTTITAEETISVSAEPDLSISKSISPVPVMENGTVTYTFVIQNTGNTPVKGGAVITDTFNPIISNITAVFNDTPWVQGVDYSYDQSTGVFISGTDRVTVDAATYSQDSTTGIVNVTPGTSTLVITGTI